MVNNSLLSVGTYGMGARADFWQRSGSVDFAGGDVVHISSGE